MKWIMEGCKNLTNRYKKSFLICMICLFLGVLSSILTWTVTHNLYDQQAANRWSEEEEYAQISCFYPISVALSDFDFQSLHHSIEESLKKASLEANENAKLFVDAYSATGKIVLSGKEREMEVNVVGVSDCFFTFHPVTLLAGAYFDDEMLMKDGVILDEEAAFRLYGSSDVVGMPLYIGGMPYYIRGVVAHEDGYFAKKAGLSSSVCYVAMETLEKYGTVEGSYTYEVIMPNSVEGFAKGIVTEVLNDTNQQIEVVENSLRFSFDAKKDIVMDFGIRSMSRNSILYPYWENIARATEDVCGVLFVIQTVSFGIATVLILWYVRICYKNRTWNIKMIWERIRTIGKK